jgi:hypothetical protein
MKRRWCRTQRLEVEMFNEYVGGESSAGFHEEMDVVHKDLLVAAGC